MKRVHHTNSEIILTKKDYSQDIYMKPKGLWYDVDSSWLEWCEENMPEWKYKNHFELELNESKILIIDTYNKLIDFDKEYSKKMERISIYNIDWGLVQKKYSGIEISPYRYDCRLSLDWFYGWDVASGCIWNFDCLKSIK